ncbi:Stress up-regulated Nod 19 [Sesbania bispinosa]|nr:Stress up-regulated Nod 19 [Sesbania bispinosa]
MRLISKTLIFLLSTLVLLSSTTYSIYQGPQNPIKSATFVSESFEVGPGSIVNKAFLDIQFPRGHVGVKSFDAELVDEEGNSVPLYDTYLHHFFAIKYFVKANMSKDGHDPFEGFIFKRNEGMCNSYILPHYWGLGTESRGTTSKIPDPFAVEHGNPAYIPPGYQEKWLLNIMGIDTRGAKDKKGCTECRCDRFNLPKDFYNVTMGIDGKPLSTNYKGGIFCCHDGLQCKLKKGAKAPSRKLSLRYKITWVEWDEHQIPLKFYILDSTDRVRKNGTSTIHDCQAEYTIMTNGGSDYHVQKANIPMEKGGYLIYGTAHMHAGAVNATLYGQDGRTLCTSTPKYGTGKEPGNEEGYNVGMSVCYPKPGSVKINDGETLTVESRYESGFLTGVMGQMYIYVAEKLPQEKITPQNNSPLLM